MLGSSRSRLASMKPTNWEQGPGFIALEGVDETDIDCFLQSCRRSLFQAYRPHDSKYVRYHV